MDGTDFVEEKRILTYRGPAAWIRSCAANAFVALEKDLGGGKSLHSEWENPVLQTVAVATPDSEKRSLDVVPLALAARSAQRLIENALAHVSPRKEAQRVLLELATALKEVQG